MAKVRVWDMRELIIRFWFKYYNEYDYVNDKKLVKFIYK